MSARRGARGTPPLAVSVNADGVRSPVARAKLADVARMALHAEGARAAMVSVTLLSSAAMARLNERHLKHRGPTDVISFGFRAVPGGPVVGDIYIAPAVARANAIDAQVSIREEVVRLVVHGVLHVMGHDHPTGATRASSPMWKRQESLVRRARSVAGL